MYYQLCVPICIECIKNDIHVLVNMQYFHYTSISIFYVRKNAFEQTDSLFSLHTCICKKQSIIHFNIKQLYLTDSCFTVYTLCI